MKKFTLPAFKKEQAKKKKEDCYTEPEDMFEEASQLIDENGLTKKFEARAYDIVDRVTES